MFFGRVYIDIVYPRVFYPIPGSNSSTAFVPYGTLLLLCFCYRPAAASSVLCIPGNTLYVPQLTYSHGEHETRTHDMFSSGELNIHVELALLFDANLTMHGPTPSSTPSSASLGALANASSKPTTDRHLTLHVSLSSRVRQQRGNTPGQQ